MSKPKKQGSQVQPTKKAGKQPLLPSKHQESDQYLIQNYVPDMKFRFATIQGEHPNGSSTDRSHIQPGSIDLLQSNYYAPPLQMQNLFTTDKKNDQK